MRKLASIQRIKSLSPIEGADAIEKAQVLGWEIVVKKGEFKVGDLMIYCEIDSIMPQKPEYEFLRPRNFRIKTIKLKGQISQGICFPLSFLPEGIEIEEDKDLTEILGVEKYEIQMPASLQGIAKGRFPTFIPKTDETRVQVLQTLLDRYKGVKCYISEKVDGSSVTYFIKDGEFGVCSRNYEIIEDDENTLWKVARQLDIENKLRALNKNFALQGELVGESIQSNKLKLKGQTVMVFNAYDIDQREYLGFDEFTALLNKMEIPTVPVISTDYELENDIAAIVKMATIKSKLRPDVWAEGIVIRPLKESAESLLSLESLLSGRVSFKAINPEFLLKYGE